MRLVSAFCLTALFAVSSSAQASDPSMQYYQPYRAISPIADATFSDTAPTPVSDGTVDTVPYDPAPVTQGQGGCSSCGQNHSAPQAQYAAPQTYYHYQAAEEPGFFGRVMKIERRKNRWLLGLIGR